MKLEDLAFSIAKQIFSELEKGYGFSVPEDVRKAVIQKVQANLDALIE